MVHQGGPSRIQPAAGSVFMQREVCWIRIALLRPGGVILKLFPTYFTSKCENSLRSLEVLGLISAILYWVAQAFDCLLPDEATKEGPRDQVDKWKAKILEKLHSRVALCMYRILSMTLGT